MSTTPPPLDVLSALAGRSEAYLDRLKAGRLDPADAPSLRHSVRLLSRLGSGAPLLALAYSPEADDEHSRPLVDEKEMSATFTITTPRRDRYGDEVVPRGCTPHLANFTRNPRVFFAHKSSDMSIGSARRPSDGSLALDIFDDRIRSTCYFHGETAESEVVFRLVKRRELEASSIGFIPVLASIIEDNDEEEPRKRRKKDEEEILKFKPWFPLRFLEWDLTEWSIVPVPANPDASASLTVHLEKGHVEGERIPPSLKKALEPFKLRAKVWSPGFNPETTKFSGVLALGESELEYDSGKLLRIDDVSLAKQEVEEEKEKTEEEKEPLNSPGVDAQASGSPVPSLHDTISMSVAQLTDLVEKAVAKALRDMSTLDDTAGGTLTGGDKKDDEKECDEYMEIEEKQVALLESLQTSLAEHAASNAREHADIVARLNALADCVKDCLSAKDDAEKALTQARQDLETAEVRAQEAAAQRQHLLGEVGKAIQENKALSRRLSTLTGRRLD